MIRPIIVVAMLAAFVLAACGGGALPPREDIELRTRGLTEPEQVSLEALPALGTQVSLGQPITVDASVLPGIIGAPPLSGQLVLDFLWTDRGPVVEDRIRPLVVGATFKPIEAHEGEFLVVHYIVENKADAILQPLRRINDNLSLIDSQGRKYVPAGFQFYGFAVGAAFALQTGGDDTRDMLAPGSQSTTAVAFDVALDASGFRLRSEAGNFEVALVGGAGRPKSVTLQATPTLTPTVIQPTATATTAAKAPATSLPEGQDPTEYLIALMTEQFSGLTNRDCASLVPCEGKIPRLHSIDVRAHFQGGLRVIVEFSADEFETDQASKSAFEKQIWDAINILFSSPAADHVTDTFIMARDVIETHYDRTIAHNIIVYKAWVTREMAAQVDWSKPTAHLSDAWETLIVNIKYR